MKKLVLSMISFLMISFFCFGQKSPQWSWPQCRNTNGGSQEQPATIYLGDQGTFGHDSWDMVDGKWPKWRVVIYTGTDINNGTYGAWSSYSNVQHKTSVSPRFTTTGTYYWGMQVEYTDAGTTTGWYCRNDASWNNMWGAPTSNLSITVSALNNPTASTPFTTTSSSIALGWSKDAQAHNIMVVRKSGGSFTAPTQGTSYTVSSMIGSGTVVYYGTGTSFTDTGLSPSTIYDYIFYSENYSYYSSGVIASATTATTSSTDYFRSKATGNWNTAGTWESSPNNTSWVTSILVPGVSSSAITILNGHTITLDSDVSIPGLSINNGATFTASDGSPRVLTIAKSTSGSSTTLSNSGTWNNGTGGSTVVFTGAPSSGDAIHAISGNIGFQKITINKTGGTSNVGASFGSNSSVSGTLEIGTGGYISTAPPTSFYGSDAILKFNQGSGATYNVYSGDYSWSTTVIPNNISISSGTVNLNSSRTAIGNLIIDGGTLSLSAALTINGNWTRTSGTFTPNSQLVTLSGTTNTIINTATEASLYDLTISKTGSGYVSLSSGLVVSRNLTISTGSLIITPNKYLTVNGTLANSAGNLGLVIKSDATGTGSLITPSTPAATVERYTTKYITGTAAGNHMFHYISSPVSSQAIHPEFVDYPTPATNADFYSYSETSNLWINTKADNGSWNGSFESTFAPGKGYSVAYPGDVTKNFTGNVYSYTSGSPLVMTCSKTTGQGEGWNLLGNPFPSAIDWESVTRSSGMDKALYYYNSTYYSTYIDINGAYIGHGSQYIPAMQGFMVHASANGATVTIQNSDRAHHAQTTFYKSSNTVPNSLSLKVAEAGYEDEMFVHFTLGATANFDGDYDAYKLDAAGNGMPIIYSTAADNTKLAINGLPELTENTVVPVNFSAGTDGECTITADLQNLTDARVFLVDNKLTKVQNLSDNPVYTFTASTSDQPNRFKLTFGSVGIIEPLGAEHLQVYIDNGNLVVIGKTTTNAQIMVSNMLGQVVLRSQTNGNSLTKLNVNSIPNGVYVVSLVGNSKMVSEKIVVSK